MKSAKGKFTMKKSGSGKYETYWIYVPKKMVEDDLFPFTDKEEVIIEMTENGLNIKKSNILQDLLDATGVKSATLPNMLEQKALENKDKPFIYYEDEQISYHQTNVSSNCFSHGFSKIVKDLNLRKPTIALLWPSNPNFLFLWFAIVKSGSIFLPIDTTESSEMLKFMLESSKAEIAILDYRYFEKFNEIKDQLSNLKKVIIQDAPDDFEFDDFFISFKEIDTANTSNPDRIVKDVHKMQINFTSGTTGKPKGFIKRNYYVFICFNIGKVWKDFGFKESQTVHCPIPLYHNVHQIFVVLPALISNGSIFITEKFNPESFWEKMEKNDVSGLIYFRNNLLDLLNQTPNEKDRDHPVKWAFGMGATKDVWQAFENRFGVTLHEGWTLLEGNGIIVNKSGTKEGKIGSIGKPPIGYEVKIVDEKGVMLPPGPNNIGEIITRRTAASPVLEYLENSMIEKDQEYCIIKDGWSYSRDYGYRDNDDYVYFVGRSIDKILHEKGDFYAHEIENVVRTHPYIIDCAVFGVPGESSQNEDIKLVAELNEGMNLKYEELYNYMIQSLAYYKVPRYIEFKPELPRSSTTLIKKYILKEQWKSQISKRSTWDSNLKDFIK